MCDLDEPETRHAVADKPLTMFQMIRLFFLILAPERAFYWTALIYGIGIGLLSLATPISVQMLINTIANTAMATPLIALSVALFGLLLLAVLLNALRTHLMEIFARRFYARMVAEIALRSIYARNPYFGDTRRTALFNRYFDILTVQKTISVLFIGGFTVLLQASVGFVVVSFYHPLFLAFVLVIIALIWAIWLVWGGSAVRTAIGLSQRKHETAAWLERLGTSDGFFKSEKRIEFAMAETDARTRAYVQQHRKHFRRHFAQTLAFLLLYAGASAVLLGLGGWLVINNELTIGQLVAAELILSAAFFGVSQLGVYLNYFYDLCAAVEELSLFYDVKQEQPARGRHSLPARASAAGAHSTNMLVLRDVRGQTRTGAVRVNLTLAPDSFVMMGASDYGLLRFVSDLLKRHIEPESGLATLGGVDLQAVDAGELRQNVFVLNRPTFVENTIRGYLELSQQGDDPTEIVEVLDIVGLSRTIEALPRGLDMEVAGTGWPLSTVEMMQLKLAAAILARPSILVLSHLYDMVPEAGLRRALAALRQRGGTTVIYLSNRLSPMDFKTFVFLERDEQTVFTDFDAYLHATGARAPGAGVLGESMPGAGGGGEASRAVGPQPNMGQDAGQDGRGRSDYALT